MNEVSDFEVELNAAELVARAPKDGETICLHPTCRLDRLAVIELEGKQYAVRGKDVQAALDEHVTKKCLRYFYSDTTKTEHVWIFTSKTGGAKHFLGPQGASDWVVIKKSRRAITEVTKPANPPDMPAWRFSDLAGLIPAIFEIIDNTDHPIAKQLMSQAQAS